MKLKYKIWLDNEGKVFGEGPYQLLCGVKSSGSLAQAAKELNMSYSRAHGLMKYLSNKLGFALIDSQAGGSGGGGTRVTPQAEELMRRYESFMRESTSSLEEIFARHFGAAQSADIPTAPALATATAKKAFEARSFAQEPASQPLPERLPLPPKLRPLQLAERDVVALTGGGGKSSIMYALAEELAASGAKVLLTTTTKIFLPEHGAVHRLIISDEHGVIEQLRQGIAPKEIVSVGCGVHEGKLLGLSPETVDQLADLAVADYLLVEADGAAGLPFKAPAAHEPVIPQSSTVVLNVVGLDALEVPLSEEYCHRPLEIASICGLPIGACLDGRAIADVMISELGGRKNLPRGAHWLPVINKIDSEADFPAAAQIARALVKAGAENVAFASALRGRLTMHLWSKDEQ